MEQRPVAVVTGANKGIGLAIVRRLCKEYDGDVILTARNESLGKEAVKSLEGEGLHPKFHQLDIIDDASIDKLKHFLVDNYSGVSVLINNAAILHRETSTASLQEQADETNHINFFGTLNMCNKILPVMKDGGRLVNIASRLSHLSYFSKELAQKLSSSSLTIDELSNLMRQFASDFTDGVHKEKGWTNKDFVTYSVSKIGVVAMTKIFARRQDLTARHIQITTCCPGYVDTDMSAHKGPLTPDEGADTPFYLGTLPEFKEEVQGQFFELRQPVIW